MSADEQNVKTPRSIRFSDFEWQWLSEQAGEAGMTVREWIRHRTLTAPEVTKATNEERSVRRAVWFLYADRLAQLEEADEHDKVDKLLAEAREKFE